MTIKSFVLSICAVAGLLLAAVAAPASVHQPSTLNYQLAEMAYVNQSDIAPAEIPQQQFTEALDDNNDGVADVDVWAGIQTGVQTEIDGILGQRYTVPFADPLPAVVKHAARVLAIEAVFKHRGLAGEKSTYKINADAQRKKLAAIAAGDEPLAPEAKRSKPSASAITEPSKTHSDRTAI